MDDSVFEFTPPPECPVFKPTATEFQDPIGFINKIRPIAEKAGICKIIPPSSWNPPFAVDIDTFKFTPRVQKLNELEATSRIKLFFLDSLAKFWELQGHTIKVPNVDRKILDLFKLRKIVLEEGGYLKVTEEKRWGKITQRLGFPHGKHFGSTIRGHYGKILYPYDIFKSIGSVDLNKIESDVQQMQTDTNDEKIQNTQDDISKENEVGNKNISRRHSSRLRPGENLDDEGENIDFEKYPELRKLQFIGAGPKMVVAAEKKDQNKEIKEEISPSSDTKRMKTREKGRMTYIDHYMCQLCGRGDDEAHMLLCDGCDDAYHTKCLYPPVYDIPKGDWRCPDCINKECKMSEGPYGFQQSVREYKLNDFGEKCDVFKSEYFGQPAYKVPSSVIEKEFWRLVNSLEDDVCVEYGADIHATEMGSGFPTQKHTPMASNEYKNSKWNLNNLSVLNGSLLRYVAGNVSGMKVPWCYVGMCFSSFAWHTEDHWSYSINFLHWGDPKTWYGVPGSKAEMLEACMKQYAPELFEQSPDLLHQLTTIINPNKLMAYGVPVVRADQKPGEFMVTFPRAYHSGFNQGFNFAEAVNFMPIDWLDIGRQCVLHYQKLNRYCVFSHDELVINISKACNNLDLSMLTEVLNDARKMYKQETDLRSNITKLGIIKKRTYAFKDKPDDERICDVCKTTLFLSGVICDTCSSRGKQRIFCLSHAKDMCSCTAMESKVLLEGLSLDEIEDIINNLLEKTSKIDLWKTNVDTFLSKNRPYKLSLEELQELKQEAIKLKYPNCVELKQLTETLTENEKYEKLASQLIKTKSRTRQRSEGYANIKLNDLSVFVDKINLSPCHIPSANHLRKLLGKSNYIYKKVCNALLRKRVGNEEEIKMFENLLEEVIALDVELPNFSDIKNAIAQCKWLAEVDKLMDFTETKLIDLDDLKKIVSKYSSVQGNNILCQHAIRALHELLTSSEKIEEEAKLLLTDNNRQPIEEFYKLIDKSKKCPVVLENILNIQSTIDKYSDWIAKCKEANNQNLFLNSLENLINSGKQLPIKLPELERLQLILNKANIWLEKCEEMFIRKKSNSCLLDVLLPKRQFIDDLHIKRNKNEETIIDMSDKNSDEYIINEINLFESKVLENIFEIRRRNFDKTNEIFMQYPNFENIKVCSCKKPPNATMLQCTLCCDLFHVKCVALPKQLAVVLKPNSNLIEYPTKQHAVNIVSNMQWLCTLCHKSRRPSLESIHDLFNGLNNFNGYRIKEGIALKRLFRKSIEWKQRANEFLSLREICSIMYKIDIKRFSKNNVPVDQTTEAAKALISMSSGGEHDYSLNKKIPPTKLQENNLYLNGKLFEQLENIIIEGSLLEVFVEEMNDLWKIYQVFAKKEPGFQRVVFCDSFHNVKLPPKKRSFNKDLPINNKKLKRNSSDNIKLSKTKFSKSKNRKTVDEDELCEAKPCLKPSGEKEIVSWVQCDKCNCWFHLMCVGIKENQLKENEDYLCSTCNRKLVRANSKQDMMKSPMVVTPISLLKQQSRLSLRQSSSEGDDVDFVAVAAKKNLLDKNVEKVN